MLILNGVVHPMDGPVIPRGFVAFEGEKLTAVGPMEALPAGACSGMPWALRRTTETSPPTPVPPSSGPSTG